jgi:hypothetical protein
MTGLVIKLNGGRKLKLTVGAEFWSLWRVEIRLSLGSGYGGRVFFIAHVVMVAIFGRLVMKTTADTSISKIRRRNLLIESVELGWLGWPGVSFTVRAEENVIGSLFGGLREWFWIPLETV